MYFLILSLRKNIKIMSFLQFPIIYSEDDFEHKEDLNLPIEKYEGVITVNTNAICAYNEMTNGNTMLRMANGDAYECPISINAFEAILSESEVIVDLTKIGEN